MLQWWSRSRGTRNACLRCHSRFLYGWVTVGRAGPADCARGRDRNAPSMPLTCVAGFVPEGSTTGATDSGR